MSLPRITLTYRSSPSGRVHGAYMGNVRVGYVEQRAFDRWMWQLIVLAPEGNAYRGLADDEREAKEQCEQAWYHWCTEAGLIERPPLSSVRSQQPSTTDKPRRTFGKRKA